MKKKKKKNAVKQGLQSAKAGLSLQAEIGKVAKSSGFNTLLTSTQRTQLYNGPTYDRSFADAVATSYEAHPQFAEDNFDVTAMREDLATIAAYTTALTAAKALVRSLRDGLLQRKSEVTSNSSEIFNHLKGLSMTAKGAVLQSDVDELTKLRRPTPRSPKKSAEAPAAQGSPDPVNTK